jgi:glucose-6-phosphate isomerase
MSLQYRNLDTTDTFAVLQKLPVPSLHELLTTERVSACTIPAGGGLSFNYAALPIDNKILSALTELAEEQQLIDKYRALLDGERMNTGENRMVLHHLTRGQLGNAVEENGQELRTFYKTQLDRISAFTEKVHTGNIKSSTGKEFTTVVQIGIGGSDLGPRALYLALRGYYSQPKMEAHFISNVDPDDAAEVLGGIDLERTLFILVSKSGTTQETLTNQQLVYNYLSDKAPRIDPRGHMLAVTSSSSPLAESDEFLDSFYIDDYIGGRYSSTSAVGATVLSLAFGADEFKLLLKGAHSADRRALEPSLYDNAALADALFGVYMGNILEYRVNAILPYSQALVRFPAHLQQLDMESNGKRVNRSGTTVKYHTGPVIFGEPGTNGQHSFYQLLHQGTEKVAQQFIGFIKNQRGIDTVQDGFSSRQKLNANLAAQIVAFAKGKQDKNANKNFPGDRPSSLLYGEELTPESLGALLAHYENKIMFQGFTWNVNSFDQEGVQLGKLLTKEVLGGEPQEASLSAYARLLGVL